MLATNTYPINNHNQYSINTYNTRMSDKLANNMPNGLLRVAETQINRNIENNIKNIADNSNDFWKIDASEA